MPRNEMCREVTAEHAYQEDLLENSYRTSGNPDFLKRADIMQRTFELNPQGQNQEGMAGRQLQTRTVFEQ